MCSLSETSFPVACTVNNAAGITNLMLFPSSTRSTFTSFRSNIPLDGGSFLSLDMMVCVSEVCSIGYDLLLVSNGVVLYCFVRVSPFEKNEADF